MSWMKPSASQNLITVKMALNNVHGMAVSFKDIAFLIYAFSYQRYPMANLFINAFHLIWSTAAFASSSQRNKGTDPDGSNLVICMIH